MSNDDAGHGATEDSPFLCDAWGRRVHRCQAQCDGCFRKEYHGIAHYLETVRAALERAKDCLYNSFEPDNQSRAYHDVCAALKIAPRSETRFNTKDAEAAIELFLEYRDKHGQDEDAAKAAALNEFAEAASEETRAAVTETREDKA